MNWMTLSKLARPTKRNYPALPYVRVGDLMTKLAGIERSRVVLALRFAILTAGRSGEVRLARWDEIDLAAGLWSIPADRMKARKPHVLPLSPQACDVLREAEKHRCGPYVFPGDVIAAR
jgi:integrase